MFSKFFAAIAAFVFIFTMSTSAQFDDISQSEQITVDIGGTSENDNFAANVAVAVPLDWLNGGLQAYYVQQQAEGKITSQTTTVRVEGGFDVPFLPIDVAGFVEYDRSVVEGTQSVSVGPFFRLPEYKNGRLSVTSGFGSYVENQEVIEDLGLDEGATYSLRPFVYASVKYGPISTLITKSTDFSKWRAFEIAAEPSLVVAVDDRVSIGVQGVFKYDREAPVKNWVSRVSFVARTKF